MSVLTIRQWVEMLFAGPKAKVFLELGAHRGEDTAWMAALPNVSMVAFEPDPRNELPDLRNVTVIRAAVSDRVGTAPFLLSETGWGMEWTLSSSLRTPKNHLKRFPVTFGKTISVPTITLDSLLDAAPLIGQIDFIWCDIQGSEVDMVRGATRTLKQTRYLYTEYSNEEMYEGQATLAQLLAMLRDFRIVSVWPEDVLLENMTLSQKAAA
jgi:2-O-methyltransferase